MRELEGKDVTPADSPPVSPERAKPIPGPPAGHVRRSASVSYSSTETGSVFNYAPAALSPPPLSKAVPSIDRTESPTLVMGAHRRRASKDVGSIMIPEVLGLGQVEGVGLDGLREEEEPRSADSNEDVFLPLSPNSAAPFQVRFNGANSSSNGTTPSSAQFPRLAGAEHARKHSRIHERNLSAFFPRPGTGPSVGYGDVFEDPNGAQRKASISDIPSPSSAGTGSMPSTADSRGDRRRGHHHKHSVSHQFFSLLDPNDPNSVNLPSSAVSSTGSFVSAPHSANPYAPLPTPLPVPYSHLATPFRLLLYVALQLPASTQFALALSAVQIILGATMWITGQSGESLSVTGLGYLVVFDGMGGLSSVLVEGGKGVEGLWSIMGSATVASSVRLPFGYYCLSNDACSC